MVFWPSMRFLCNCGLWQISGAMVVVHAAQPGMFDGKVIVSGTPDQIRVAQRLVHAFILCGKTQS